MKRAVAFAFCLTVTLFLGGCGPSDDLQRTNASTGIGGKKDLSPAGNGEDLALETRDLTYEKPDACASVSAVATLTKKPVDVIFVIDNSGSMSQEIAAVQNNINVNFADILGTSGLDYRVIMLSKYNTVDYSAGYYRVCIKGPLGGNSNCDNEPKPINTANFFHYNQQIDSTDSFQRILDSYKKRDPSCGAAPAACSAANGWSDWLRADALKVFIEVTDDDSNTLYTAFETSLFALTPKMFGSATDRNYMFYSIVGLKENTPATTPYPDTANVVTTSCSTAVGPGQDYQQLSKLTKALRYPVCQTASYNAVFQAVAQGVIAGAKVDCSFAVPDATGGVVNLTTVIVNYTPSNGDPVKSFMQVDDISQCTAAGNFYITQDADMGNKNMIQLCPDTCTTVQKDDKAQIGVLFDCVVG
jgi:hypothetical protein